MSFLYIGVFDLLISGSLNLTFLSDDWLSNLLFMMILLPNSFWKLTELSMGSWQKILCLVFALISVLGGVLKFGLPVDLNNSILRDLIGELSIFMYYISSFSIGGWTKIGHYPIRRSYAYPPISGCLYVYNEGDSYYIKVYKLACLSI